MCWSVGIAVLLVSTTLFYCRSGLGDTAANAESVGAGIGSGCAGDCNGDAEVTVDEIVSGVGIALGTLPIANCAAVDSNGDAEVTIDEIIQAVANALGVCMIIPTPLPTFTATPTPIPTTLFVRASGDDSASGESPSSALRTIHRATAVAHSHYRLVVGPGTYPEGVATVAGSGAPQALEFVADTTGALTGDLPGPVIIDAATASNGVGLRLSGSADSRIEGFTIINATDSAIVLRTSSDRVTVQDCVIHDNPGAGIRVQDSADVLIFNNLIHNNGTQGIAIVGNMSGSPTAHLFSNTIVANGDRGITIGNTNFASPDALLRNNIVQENGLRLQPPLENIKVFTTPLSTAGLSSDYNLVFPASYFPLTIAGSHDINADALFVFAAGDDFRLHSESPAIDAGDQLPSALAEHLRQRVTTDAGPDVGVLDLGYHFP